MQYRMALQIRAIVSSLTYEKTDAASIANRVGDLPEGLLRFLSKVKRFFYIDSTETKAR
jgi:hypothetical protein